ncbi:MAG TPA: DMT family transporter [Bacillales bacterium]|nr:DMT family transporter [Bacillales bacterium]
MGKEGVSLPRALTYGLLFFVMIVWGLNVIAIKIVVEHFPPLLITSLRIGLAGIVVLMILIFQKNFRAMSKKEWLYTIAGGLLGMVSNQSLLAAGLSNTSASNAALILALVPLTTAVLAMIFLGERLTFFRLIGIVLALIGIAFVILEGSGGLSGISIGAAYVFGAMFSQAFSFIWINKATETLPPRQATAIMLTMGALIMFLMSLFIHPSGVGKLDHGTLGVWMVFVASSIVATAMGQMLYNMAIHQIGAGASSIFMNLTPFFSLLGSVVFLGESITLAQIFGFVFIVAGVLFGTGYIDKKFAGAHQRGSQLLKKHQSG